MTEPVASTDRGRVRGSVTAHGYRFLGIPYAKAPFGPRRFRAPEVTDAWDGERPALRAAPTAPQPATGFTMIPEPTIDGGEAPDCLSLNVFTPELDGAGLPVLVWIHGGGFITGTPSSTWYDGDRFARDGVVVVSVGYRLGAEGFLHIPGAPANRGVLDWLAALEWVQRNVSAFGGDPGRVSVGGQSAGGVASLLLATLPRAAGLFRAVIPMSGSVFSAASADATFELTERVAAQLAIAPRLEEFERVPPAALVDAQVAASGGGSAAARLRRPSFWPFVDGETVPTGPMRAIAGGAAAGLGVLIGTTEEEFNAAVAMTPMDEEGAARALAGLGLDEAGVAAYRAAGGSPARQLGQAVTDRNFRVPALRVAEARGGPGPTYHYEFQWHSPALGGIGAAHCLDLPFVFDVLDDDHVAVVAGDAPPKELAVRMHGAWVAFVTDGDPGWPAFERGGRTTMVFDETDKLVSDLLGEVGSRWP